MLEEKTMVADALTGINGELMRFGEMIPQTDNKELQNHAETVKGRLRAVSGRAVSDRAGKSYYVPAAKATQEEVNHVKSLFSGKTM